MLSKIKTILNRKKIQDLSVIILPTLFIIFNHFINSTEFNLFFLLFVFLLFVFLVFLSPFLASLLLLSTVSLEKFSFFENSSIKIYEILSIPVILNLAYLFYKNKISLKLPKIITFSLILIVVASIFGFIHTPSIAASLKYTLLFFYFLALSMATYLATFQKRENVIRTLILSSLPVLVYGIFQSLAYKFSLFAFETMPGRVDGTFFEPDWFGMYLAVILGLMMPLLNFKKISHWIFLILIFANLLLTISRASWLASICIIFVYLLINLFRKKIKQGLFSFTQILASLSVAIFIITLFNLTPFSLSQRFLSTFTGDEKYLATQDEFGNTIQISKEEAQRLNSDQLLLLSREDTNVNSRLNSYQESFELIKKHPLFGIGLGGLSTIYSKFTNANNILLEILIGTGFTGAIPFLAILLYPFLLFIYLFFKKYPHFPYSTSTLSLILAFTAILIPNMFNSGIFLGYFWIILGIALSLNRHTLKTEYENRN
jgi:O-antigen ligase